MDVDPTLVTVAVPMAAGLAAGFVNAIAGGGSLILFPALLWVGYPPVVANVTNSVALWPGYLSGVASMRASLTGMRLVARPLVIASGAAAVGGAAALLLLPSEYFALVVPVLVAFASLLLLFQPVLARRAAAGVRAETRPAWLLPAIVGAGFYGGYFGGVVGVLLMAIVGLAGIASGSGIPALKNLLQFSINTVALVIFLASGQVAWLAVALVAPMTLTGGWVGGRLATRMHPEVLRWAVGVFGLLVAAYLFLD